MVHCKVTAILPNHLTNKVDKSRVFWIARFVLETTLHEITGIYFDVVCNTLSDH